MQRSHGRGALKRMCPLTVCCMNSSLYCCHLVCVCHHGKMWYWRHLLKQELPKKAVLWWVFISACLSVCQHDRITTMQPSNFAYVGVKKGFWQQCSNDYLVLVGWNVITLTGIAAYVILSLFLSREQDRCSFILYWLRLLLDVLIEPAV